MTVRSVRPGAGEPAGREYERHVDQGFRQVSISMMGLKATHAMTAPYAADSLRSPARRRSRPAQRSDRCYRAATATHRPPPLEARMIGTSVRFHYRLAKSPRPAIDQTVTPHCDQGVA